MHWGDFPSVFEKKFSTQVECIDFPGVGEFYQGEGVQSIEAIADHVFEQMDKRSLKTVNVLAHSLGAMVSSAMLQKEPSRFDQCVWINTSFANLSPWYKRMNIKNISKLTTLFVYFDQPDVREKIIYELTTNMHHDRSLIQAWVEIQKEHPIVKKTVFHQLWAASRYRCESLPQKNILLLASKKDHFVDVSCIEAIASKFQLPIVFHEEAGHDIPVDDPEWICKQIASHF
ncbi:MAG: alpha/beta hydrolase [Bdellovibrionales bacterium]|nr:alpha/beta hydrolase [Bdellovibrionales bacterium]